MRPDDPRAFADTELTEPVEPVDPTAEIVGAAPGPHWTRRGFLKAAALGTAAAAMFHKDGDGLHLGPLTAYADNLSGLNCTANDVRIIGPGQIINEPCGCTGTFDAQVKFRINNNTGTTRYCVTVHFCPANLPGGGTFDPGDVLIGDIPPGEADYTVTIPNYPCGRGLVCFGARGPEADGGFPKGAACPAGACCTTISWDVNPGCPTRTITSKCRHQLVCIQGRGFAFFDCDTATTGVQASCAVACGATTTIRLCTTDLAALGPFTFVVKVPGQPDQTFTGPGPCHDFTVGPITATTTVTGEVTSQDGCKKTARTALTTSPITVQLAVSGGATCGSGDLTFTASTGQTGCTYQWKVDGVVVPGVTGATFNYPADPDSACHTVSVVATCGGCVSNAASTTVSQCVTTTTGCTP